MQKRPNQAMQPIQRFVATTENIRTVIFKVLVGEFFLVRPLFVLLGDWKLTRALQSRCEQLIGEAFVPVEMSGDDRDEKRNFVP